MPACIPSGCPIAAIISTIIVGRAGGQGRVWCVHVHGWGHSVAGGNGHVACGLVRHVPRGGRVLLGPRGGWAVALLCCCCWPAGVRWRGLDRGRAVVNLSSQPPHLTALHCTSPLITSRHLRCNSYLLRTPYHLVSSRTSSSQLYYLASCHIISSHTAACHLIPYHLIAYHFISQMSHTRKSPSLILSHAVSARLVSSQFIPSAACWFKLLLKHGVRTPRGRYHRSHRQ